MKPSRIPCLIIAFMLLCGGFSQAQDAAGQKTQNPTAPPATKPNPPGGSTATTSEAASVRNIRFQFDGIPYADVLERFAQMANKPLVADTNLQGTLSYNDPQPYTYQEALDTLNVMLSMKGVMLMEDGHYLRVVPFKQLPQMPLRILRGLDQSGDVRPGEIVTVVLEVKNLETKEVADAVVSMLSNAGSIAPLSRGRGLIVTDKLSSIQRIRALLSAIDNESVAQRQMKAFTLVHASGAVVADLINRTFGSASAAKRTQYNPQTKQMDILPPDPNDYVTAVYDDASRTLVLFGPRDRLTLAEELVSKFEDKEGGPGDVRIYYPQVTKADELAQMIHQAVPGVAGPKETGAASATKARVIADMAQNRLIVAAPIAGQLDQIELLINSLDKPVHGTAANPVRSQTVQMTKVFRVRSSDAASVAKILSQALSKRLPTGATVPTANVTVEPNSQSVVVTGSPGDVQTAIDIVTQLEGASASPQSRRLQMITLQHQRVDTVQPTITKLISERMSDKRFEGLPNPLVLPDAAHNRLLVTATDEQFKEIQEVVSALDLAQDKGKREMTVIPVQSKSATEIINLTTQLMTQLGEEQTNPQLAPKLIADPSGKQIIVLATAKDLERITNLVQRLDGASYATASRQFKGVELFSRTAAELTPLVQQLYSEQLKGLPEPAGGAATLLSDAKNNRIMVSGSEKEIARVETIIRQLDPEGRKLAKDETRIVRLKSGLAADIAGLVEKSLSGQTHPIKVLVDVRSNSLVVTGDPGSVEAAAQIIDQLDTRSEMQPRELRVIDLKQGEAASVAQMVTSLSVEMLKDQRGPEYTPQIKVVPDAAANRLILTGPKDELKTVSNLVEQLNQSSDSGAGARVFKLKSADATTVAQLVSEAMVRFDGRRDPIKRVSVSADKESNSVIVSGSRSDLQDAQTIIERLDNEGTGTGRSLKVVDVLTDDTEALATLATKVFASQNAGRNATGTVSITAQPSGKRLIVLAPTSLIAQVEMVITNLDAKPEAGGRELQTVDLKNGSAQELLSMVNRIYAEQAKAGTAKPATIYAHSSGSRLMVYGTKDQATSIRQIVETLETEKRAPRETRSFEVGNAADVQRLLALVKQLYLDQWKDKAATDPADAQIVGDMRTGRLIVTGKPEHIKQIEVILTQLNNGKPRADGRDTKVFDLTSANAVELATTVRTLYQDEAKVRLGTTPPDTLILPDPSANRLVVSGEIEELNAVEELIKKLDKVSTQSASTRVFKLKSADPDKVSEILSTALVRYDAYGRPQKRVSVVVDAKTRTLIATGDAKELQGASIIIEQLDSIGAQPERKMKVLPVKAGRVSDLITKLRQLYQDQVKSQPELGVSDALLLEDSASNQVILAGSEAQMQLIERIAGQLQENTLDQTPRETRVYDLNTTSASELATTVRTLYQDGLKSNPIPVASQALILPDAAANRLVISGTTNQLAAIDEIVQKLDRVDAQTGRTRVFKLKTAEAEQVATVLSTALAQISASGRTVPRITVGADRQNNLLIVSGEPKDLQAASVIVEQMDAVLAKEPRQMRILSLKSGVASQLSTRVRSLYQDQMKGQPKNGAADALIMGDDVSNRLIVTASESHTKVIEDIVKQLEASGESASRELRVVMLQRNSAASIATMITQLFSRQTASQDPADRLSVTSSRDDRTLVVDATTPTHQKIGELIKALDGDDALAAVEVRTYHFPEGNAADLAPTLARLFNERAGQSGDGGGQQSGGRGGPRFRSMTPRFEADAAANVLMVAALKDQFVQIDKLIEELKKTAQVASEIRTFKLQNSDATQIAEVLQAMLTDGEALSPGARLRRNQARASNGLPPLSDMKGVRVSPATALNAVVVQGPPEKLALAEKLVRTLDKTESDGESVIQTVHLKKAHAENLAEAVTKTIAARGPQSRLQRVAVTAVAGPNSLLVNGPSDAVKEVMEVIKELDQESEDDEIKVHIYKLENGNAKQVSTLLQQLLQNVSRSLTRVRSGTGGSGSATRTPAQPSVAVDERSNSLVISGSSAHFKVVEQLLKTLDKVPERAERDVHFVWLKNAKAFDVVSKLEAVFEDRAKGDRPVIESDTFSNSITIIGKRADIVQVESLIARLDESSKDSSLQVRLRTLDRIPAEQMARMLQNIYPQMSAGQLRFVEKLPAPAKQEKPSTNAAPNNPANTNAAPGNSAVKEASAADEVVVAIDKNANALIFSGPTQELDQIDRIISDLSFSYISSDAEFRIFPLKEADPVIVARTLTELFKPEPIPQQQQQKQGEQQHVVVPPPKITVVAEPRTRSVIVRAKPTEFTLMEVLIKQMDIVGITAQLEYRLVGLTNALPEKVVPLVQQMVTQLNLVRPGEPLTVTADARSRGLLLVGRDSAISQVERMIHSLDTPAPFADAEVLVVSLKKANAPQLAAVLQSMLKPGTAGELTPDARELQEQIRRLKIQNENGQAVLLDLTKPIKVMTDPLAGGQGGGNRLILSSTPDNLKALATVVEMMDSVPITEGVNVKLVRLQYADATSVSQTLNTVFTQGQRLVTTPGGRRAEPEGGSGKALIHPLNVSIDGRLNTLILSGQKEALDLAQRIIDDLDRKIERFVTEVKLFRLKHASATRLAPLLQSVFAEGPAVPGTEGLNTQVTRLRAAFPEERPQVTEQAKTRSALIVQADDTANILIVAARTDSLPLIETVINQLDIPSASGLDSIRVYPLNHADVVGIQKIVNDIFSGPRAAQLRTEDKPNITIDGRTQTLIVSANGKAFAIIDSLIAQLDKQLPLELRDVRIVGLEHADAGDVAASLQRLLDARVTQQASMSRQQSESMRVLVIGEPRSNSLLITGSKDSFELVESLAKELDKAPTALSGQVRLVPVTYADARVLSTSLVNLFNQRYQAARTPEARRNRPVIIPDPRSNSLLVAAGIDDNQVIDDLLRKLDRKLENAAITLAVLPLQHNDAARVATTLEGIFSARLKAQTLPGQEASPQEQVKVEIDNLNNALIVSASRENLDIMKGLLEKIDVEPAAADGLIQTFTLQYADAQRVASMLRSLVQQGVYRPGMSAVSQGQGGAAARREAMAITVDPRSNTLVVSASPANLLIIKEVIKQTDSKDFTELGNIRMYPLKHAKASSLSTVLEQFFRAKRAGEAVAVNAPERSVPITVIPDDRVNTLLVTGSKEGFDVIDRVIAQLDGEDTMSRMNFKVFPLKLTTASKLQSTLRQLFVNRPSRIKGEQPEPITIVADAWANALIVGASVDDMDMVSSLIERLDSEQSDLGMTVQVLPLAKADARRVAQTVQGLYRGGTTGAGGTGAGTVPIAVSADERLNALVVSAGEGDIKRIVELVKKLDTDQVARVSEIRVIPLRYGKADSMSMILNTALNTKPTALGDQSPTSASLLQFITRGQDGKELVASALKEGVLITPDARMNSLIVSAPVDYMGLLEQIIGRLDSSSPQQAQIKVFNLVNADARQMAELLMGLFRLQPSGQPAGTQRSIQYTLAKQDLSSESDPEGQQAAEPASAVIGSDEQSSLHLTVDPRTNSLLVGGTEHYVALVSQIIETLDSSSAQERKSEVYRLRNAQAAELQTAVRTFLDQDRQRVTQVLGQDAVGTAQKLLEREVAIVAETGSNTLLLSASPRYFDQVKKLISDLDQPQPQVLIQVLLAEVTLDSTRDLGIEWNLTKTVEDAKLATGTDLGVLQELQSFGGFSAAVTGSDYNFLLRALEVEGRLEVLSRPQILTADNRPANINIGQRVPLITDSRVTQFGDTINSFQYQNVGVNLAVTPRIGADGNVKMEISTTNSALSSSSVEISSSAKAIVKVPIINERRATTSVSVQSGQSIIIGGLISTTEDNRIKKVPYLGDIPYVGALFRSKTRVADRKELLILLTPQVLVNVNQTAKLSDPDAFTQEELERSSIKDQIKKDKTDGFRDRLLDPLFPEKGRQSPDGKQKLKAPAEGTKEKINAPSI